MADILNPDVDSSFFLSRRDPRAKLLLLFLLPFFVFNYSFLSRLILLPILTTGVFYTGLKPLRLLKTSSGFIFILLLPPLVSLIRHFFQTPAASTASALNLSLTLLTVYLAGILIIRCTGIRGLQNGSTWLFSFIPGLQARKAGLLIGLTFMTLPRILEEWQRIKDAQRSRAGDSQKNPLRHYGAPLLTLLLNTILKAETTADALETRGYPEKENGPGKETREILGFKWYWRDTALIILSILILILLLFV